MASTQEATSGRFRLRQTYIVRFQDKATELLQLLQKSFAVKAPRVLQVQMQAAGNPSHGDSGVVFHALLIPPAVMAHHVLPRPDSCAGSHIASAGSGGRPAAALSSAQAAAGADVRRQHLVAGPKHVACDAVPRF